VIERILAARVLHSCDTQMFWECSELTACETFPEGVPRFPGVEPSMHHLHRSVGMTRNPERGLGEQSVMWAALVKSYTAASLSFPDQYKLLAISGLARRT